ncbi:translation protein SH3-like domain-containing protein [Hyaloraphidium curvatum]|nr:translation protein SH3-like domain-containing protein [Hyaloraphidium curvatum]
MGQSSKMYAFRDKVERAFRTRRPLHPDRLIKEWKVFVGDKVEVIIGVDRGKQGVVKDVIKDRNLLVVEGIRTQTRSVGPRPGYKDGKTGGVVTEERPLRCEEVLLVDPRFNKPTHVFFQTSYNAAKGQKERMRISHLSGLQIPIPERMNPLKDQPEGERDTPESLVKEVTYITPDRAEAPFPTALMNELYRMSRKGGESRAF